MAFQQSEINYTISTEQAPALTLALGFDQVEHLAEQILEGQRFDAHPLHPLTLFLIEILQLKHGQDAIAICVHAAEPVLYTGEIRQMRTELHTRYTMSNGSCCSSIALNDG